MMIYKWNSANTTFPVGWGTTRFCQSPRSCSANRCFFLPKENAPVIREDGCNKCLRIMITSRFNFRLEFKVKETDIRDWPWIDWFFFNMSTLDAFVIWRFPIGHIHMYIYINHQNILKRFNTHIYICLYTHFFTVCSCCNLVLYYFFNHSNCYQPVLESPRRHRWRVSPAPCWIRSKVVKQICLCRLNGEGVVISCWAFYFCCIISWFFVERPKWYHCIELPSCCNMIIYHDSV